MAFKDRLKEARLSRGLTQEQIAKQIGVAKSTFTGYEKGNSEPSMLTISKIMNVLKVDANFLWQDETNSLTELVVSLDEKALLRKYRDLDDHGREMVDFTLDKEYERSKALAEQTPDNIVEIRNHLEVNAANPDKNSTHEERQAGDSIMLDDSEWE